MPQCHTISDPGKARVTPLAEMGVQTHTLIREACRLLLSLHNECNSEAHLQGKPGGLPPTTTQAWESDFILVEQLLVERRKV